MLSNIATDNTGTYFGLFTLILSLSVIVGSLSFVIWIYKIGNKIIKNIIKILGMLTGSIFFLMILWMILFRYAIVDGSSMEPSYKHNEIYLVSKFALKSSDPKRGDVVDYYFINKNNERMGRIVGLPHETILVASDELTVDGNKLDEPYVDWSEWTKGREENITLKDGEFLVLFDKRGGDMQVIKKENIIGKFIFKLYAK